MLMHSFPEFFNYENLQSDKVIKNSKGDFTEITSTIQIWIHDTLQKLYLFKKKITFYHCQPHPESPHRAWPLQCICHGPLVWYRPPDSACPCKSVAGLCLLFLQIIRGKQDQVRLLIFDLAVSVTDFAEHPTLSTAIHQLRVPNAEHAQND